MMLAFTLLAAIGLASALPYEEVGPYKTKQLSFQFEVDPATTGCDGNICSIDPKVTFPDTTNGTSFPVALFLHGFQLNANDYLSTCNRLASHGYVVVAWDTNEGLFTGTEHGVLSKMAQTLFDWALAEPSLPVDFVWDKNYLVSGHSMGGKLAGLVAQADSRVKSAFLIDPVDCDPPLPGNGDWPHVLDNPSSLTIPTAVVASEYGPTTFLGQACAPIDCSHDQFWVNIPAVKWDVVVNDAGHNRFTDSGNPIVDVACKDGNVARSSVLAITQTMLVAWAENTIRSANDIDQYTGGWIHDLGADVAARVRE